MRLLHYPTQPDMPGIGIGEHTDYGCITLVTADSPGLMVKTRNGIWIDVPIIPNTFICNIGDAMSALTKGQALATPHKVISKQERYSVAFFYEPSLDSVIDLVDDSFVYGKYLLGKYEKSFPKNT